MDGYRISLFIYFAIYVTAVTAHMNGYFFRNNSNSFAELRRFKRQIITRPNNCQNEQWQCSNRDCISLNNICDGRPDCLDGSDETHALCRKMRCADHLFRCTYGACVSSTAPCNNRVDCADASDELSPICRVKSDEINGQYKCTNGQLIPVEKRCDGIPHCKDGSDENVRSCANMTCQPYLFQCAYGACANRGADCNGIIDCADGSDEAMELCGKTISTTKSSILLTTTTPVVEISSKCKLPEYPQYGTYTVVGFPNAVPGQILEKPIIEISCNTGYALDSPNSMYCVDGTWSSAPPRCVRQCKMVENPTVSYECTMMFGNNTKSSWPCREYELEGTSANATCKPNYHLGHRQSFPPIAKCIDGLWEKVINCVPECGTLVPNSTPLILGGKTAKRGELSWHVGIYDITIEYMQFCGGSIIRRSTIVSAAHCFYDVNKARSKPAENYAVAVDKIYRNWNDTRDSDVVKRFVKNIYIPKTYKHADNSHQDDIALLIVDQPFEYSAHIRPVCLDLDLTFEMDHLKPGNMGKVAGWGMIDTSGLASDVLKVVELPVVEVDTCWERAPFDFKSHITSNTFCAGYYNGTALCEGDSGGGLTFPSTESKTIRYYLRGIVSTSPSAPGQDSCNAFTATIFTKVTSQVAFLREYLHEEY